MSNTTGGSSSSKVALGNCLANLDLPPGLVSAVFETYQTCASRVVVIENSSFMKSRDGCVPKVGHGGRIERLDNVTRWQEMQDCIALQNKIASDCWLPTKYWLLNEPTGLTEGHRKKFALCWNTPEDVPDEMRKIKDMMENCILDQSQCKLTSRIKRLSEVIAKEAPRLLAEGRVTTVMIFTQGMPTNGKGQSGTTIRKEFLEEMLSLSKQPVKIIIRLTTDNEKLVNMFNDMDDRFDAVDVLDDYWGEAMEVYLHNPWLTYSIGLHHLREAGLAPEIFNEMDQRPLTLDEIHLLCQLLFGSDIPLPPYQPTHHSHFQRPSWIESWTPFVVALEEYLQKERLQWNPIKRKMAPWIDFKKLKSSLMKQMGGKSSNDFDHTNNTSFRHQRSQPKHKVTSERVDVRADLTLMEVIQHWSRKPPCYRSYHLLHDLLVGIPQTFPPMNNKVEDHVYFAKWKKFDKEAFTDLSVDELKPLLRRALRKTKFFLHPDKLPKDLTENQTILFKKIWEVITDRERVFFS